MTTTGPSVAESPLDDPSAATPEDASTDRGSDQTPVAAHRFRTTLVAGGAYLLFSVVILWWNVWSSHPTSTATCGCGDASLFTWFLAWPAYAISHGLNPLYSTAMFHPSGVNLLANTGEAGIGIVLAPVTWLFGPIATLNVADTLSPALSALAMFVLLRRWVSWAPAAFAAGLLYGFSPFILISLTDAHLMLGMAFVPPLVVACLDEMLAQQRRSPVVSGVTLGVLVTIQFFIGTEALVLMAIAAALGIVLVVLYGLVHPEILRRRASHALSSFVAAGVTSVVLLAYPVWFALAGPSHFSGSVWPGMAISFGGTNLKDYVWPSAASPLATDLGHRLGGYQAPILSGQYFGIGLVAVLVIGFLIWWRDRRLWLFAAIGAVMVPLSSGLPLYGWGLWRLFVRLPLMDNVIPSRFLVITYLCAAVMLALIIDHTRTAVDRRNAAGSNPSTASATANPSLARWPNAGSVAGVIVALIALLPIGAYYRSAVPFTTRPVVVPTWFRTVAPHLSGRQVLLVFPLPFALRQSAMTWQAVEGMHYSMVGGGGPNGILSRAGKERAGQAYLGNASLAGGVQTVAPAEITAVRQALDGWGVTTVVIPDPSPLPIYEQVQSVRSLAVLITAATGQRPIHQAEAWVWSGVGRAGPAVIPPATTLDSCVAGPQVGSLASIVSGIDCVLAARPTVP